MFKTKLVVLLLAVYFACFCVFLSSRRILLLDEFFALNLLTDHSMRHLVASWNRGADSGGLLYYLAARPWVRLSGNSALAGRLFSAASMYLAALVWYHIISRVTSKGTAALAVAAVWLCSPTILTYACFVRFYGTFLLAATCAVWATFAAAQKGRCSTRDLAVCFVSHTCLVLVHMLGIVYSGLLICSVLLSLPRRKAILLSGASMTSWLLLIPCATAIRSGSANGGSLFRPLVRDVLRFYFKNALAFPITLLALAGLVLLIADLQRGWRAKNRPDTLLVLTVSAFYLLAPVALYLVSVLVRPVFTDRYLIPSYLGLATCCALALNRFYLVLLERRFTLKPGILAGFTAAIIAVLHIGTVRDLHSRKSPAGFIASLPANTVYVVQDPEMFYELRTYASESGRRFEYLLPLAQSSSGMMGSIAKSQYDTDSVVPAQVFFRSHPSWTFLHISPNPALQTDIALHACKLHELGTVDLWGVRSQVTRVTGCL